MKPYNFVQQGAARYLTGEAAPFDQKNEMFKRPLWDPSMLDLGQKFYNDPVMPRDKPGYRLQDQAFTNACWHLESNFAQGFHGGRIGLYAWDWNGEFDYPRVPPGLKISVDDPMAVTREVKKAATFFGASLVGTCRLDRRWLYSSVYLITPEGGKSIPNEIPDACDSAIVIAVEMDYQ